MTIPFNKSRAREFAANPTIAPGKHCLVVTDAVRHIPKKEGNDNLMMKLSLKKIKDPSDPETICGPTTGYWVTLPLDNPEVEGHEAPQWSAREFAKFAAAVNEDIPAFPYFDADTKETYFRGEVIAKGDDVDLAKIECINAGGEYASELWGEDGEDFSAVIGCLVYGEVTYEDGSDFPSIGTLFMECPESWVLTDDVVREMELPEEKPEKKTTKKTSKKTSKRRK